MKDRQRALILTTPAALLLAVLFLLPLAIMALYTFRAGTFGPESQQFTLDHYREFFGNSTFQRLLWRSIVLSFWVSLFTVILAYPVAYYLAFRAGERRLLLLTIIIVPAWISYLLRVLAWKVILGGSGLLVSLLDWAGIQTSGPILIYSADAVIVTLVYVWVPFVALPIFAALERIDRSLLEAAADLGCGRVEAFLRVTLPLSLPGVIAGFLFVFIPTVGEYVTPTLVGGSEGIMFGNMVFDQFLRGLNWPLGSLMSLAMLVVILVPLFVAGRYVRLSEFT
ncbi:MAG: ABC transporter permease [Anaerolineales bacterium]|nr:ABC transporter permease [Anaerolineales bacterium]MCB0030225.1 ABC transporter permease [Anaerolineales bacterium]